jgi:hypothetical protein
MHFTIKLIGHKVHSFSLFYTFKLLHKARNEGSCWVVSFYRGRGYRIGHDTFSFKTFLPTKKRQKTSLPDMQSKGFRFWNLRFDAVLRIYEHSENHGYVFSDIGELHQRIDALALRFGAIPGARFHAIGRGVPPGHQWAKASFGLGHEGIFFQNNHGRVKKKTTDISISKSY